MSDTLPDWAANAIDAANEAGVAWLLSSVALASLCAVCGWVLGRGVKRTGEVVDNAPIPHPRLPEMLAIRDAEEAWVRDVRAERMADATAAQIENYLTDMPYDQETDQ